jgi:hypothetical protein
VELGEAASIGEGEVGKKKITKFSEKRWEMV